jgi:hypothetical protein
VAESGHGELGLHTALGRHELVPFVHYHELEVLEQRGGVGPGKEQRQALRCGHECGGKSLALAGADPGLGIAGAGLYGPGKTQILDRSTERCFGIGC